VLTTEVTDKVLQ